MSDVAIVTIPLTEYRELIEEIANLKHDVQKKTDQWYSEYMKVRALESELDELKSKDDFNLDDCESIGEAFDKTTDALVELGMDEESAKALLTIATMSLIKDNIN